MIATHKIESLKFASESMIVVIDGQEHKFALSEISSKLQSANDIQRNLFTISPSGYGIHWPLLDEDLSIPALLKSST